MMRTRAVRGWFAASLIVPVAIAGIGCGGREEGTLVEVDEEKERQLTEAMESYYMKGAPGQQPQ